LILACGTRKRWPICAKDFWSRRVALAESTFPRKKRSLKNLLLNRRLQLYYVLWVTCISAVIAAALGAIIAEYQAPPMDDAVDAALREFVERRKAEMPDQWY
jgi:hypothetical protein